MALHAEMSPAAYRKYLDSFSNDSNKFVVTYYVCAATAAAFAGA